MSIYRHQYWMDIAAPNELLTVFTKLDEALESFLGDPGFSASYRIDTDSGSVERTSRAQVSGAVDSLGGSLRELVASYTNADASLRILMGIRPFPAHPVDRIGCSLHVHGEQENETNGLFDSLRNRVGAEINRQWPKPTAAEQGTAPSAATLLTATEPAAIERKARGGKQWWGRISMHPLWTTIIGTVVGGLVLAGIVALIAR